LVIRLSGYLVFRLSGYPVKRENRITAKPVNC
jgi:hypothetical protein